ncbi:MAG: phosphate acyltransferase PlsX [Chloroflexi bacterium]|nr:phosphate acyltransferase PlsX [Chloroflexota bacterium]
MTVDVALDAMGGDLAPQSTVDGALIAVAEGITVALVGDEQILHAELAQRGGPRDGISVVHAPESIAMDANAVAEARRRRGSSISIGIGMVKRREAGAFVSVGNTGAAMATALMTLGRMRGVERPALCVFLPTPGGPTLLLDVGANAEARPSHLVQFAHFGSAYVRTALRIAEPSVGLLSIGEEASKGSSLIVEAHRGLSGVLPGFVGNVEGRDIALGTVDVVVTDGFTGNVVLKVLEGTVTMMFDQLRSVALSSLRARLGGALLLPAVGQLRSQFDYRRFGAVPLLGVDGAVFIGHGRSDAEAIASAIRSAANAVRNGMLEAVGEAIAQTT